MYNLNNKMSIEQLKMNKTCEKSIEDISLCLCCENTYTNADIESKAVTPCNKCYKCFVGDCAITACDCMDEDEDNEEKKDECCGCHKQFYWRLLNYSSDDNGTLFCDDCMPEDSDNEDSEEEDEDE